MNGAIALRFRLHRLPFHQTHPRYQTKREPLGEGYCRVNDTPFNPFAPEHLTDQEESRLQNLEALRASGIEPYPARVRRTHTIAQARALYEETFGETAQGDGNDDPGPMVSVTGRLKRIRVMGKLSFADLEDGTGQIQIVLRRDDLPDGWYNNIWKRHIDLGDFVGVSGPLIVTRTGELSVAAQSVDFLSKALKPMPD